MIGLIAIPRPSGVAKSGAVIEQFANGDGVDGAVSIVDFAEFGNVTDSRVVEGKLAAIAQLQDGDCGHGLGDGGPVIAGVGVDGLMRDVVGFTTGNSDIADLFLAVVRLNGDCVCAANNTMMCESTVEVALECCNCCI